MALLSLEPNRLTAIELLWRLRDAGYDTEKIEELSRQLGVDLPEILAGWVPVLVEVFKPARAGWWRRFLAWRK